MGTIIRKSILFALLSVSGYFVFILLWGLLVPNDLMKNLVYKRGGKGHMYSRMQEVKSVRNVDVLFIGSSLAARGFDPRVFEKHGLKTFNLGSGGQTPLQSEWLLNKYLDQLNPKVVIFEVNPYVLSRDGVEPAVDLYSNHEFEWSMFKSAFTINNIKVYNTLVFAFWQRVFGLHKNFKEVKVKGEDTYISGGYLEREIGYFKKEDLDEDLEYSLKPLKYQQQALVRSVELIKSRKIDLCLVQPPVTHLGFDQYQDEFHVEDFFKTLGNYYNFNDYVELNDTLHFFDSRHLNQHGVEIFDEAVIKILLDSAGRSENPANDISSTLQTFHPDTL